MISSWYIYIREHTGDDESDGKKRIERSKDKKDSRMKDGGGDTLKKFWSA